jgi:hypothetical protein
MTSVNGDKWARYVQTTAEMKSKPKTPKQKKQEIPAPPAPTAGAPASEFLLYDPHILIADPFYELDILKQRGRAGYKAYLAEDLANAVRALTYRNLPTDAITKARTYTEERIDARISEVYKCCFVGMDPSKPEDYDRDLVEGIGNLKVIRDFIAQFPYLAVRSEWLIDLIAWESRTWNPWLSNKLLEAVSRGFQIAAKPKWRQKRAPKIDRWAVAKVYQEKIRKEIYEDVKPLSLKELKKVGELKRAEAAVRELVEKIIAQKPALLSPIRGKLETEISEGRVYEASILVAATRYNVSPRSLRRNVERIPIFIG